MTVAAVPIVAITMMVGCVDPSPVDPDARVEIQGTAHDPTGAPLADRPVRMGTGVTDADGALAVLTVGLSCTGGGCQGDVWDTTTDTDGRFAFEVSGRDTQSTFGEARSTLVSVSGAPPDGAVSGASVSARFRVNTTRVVLPVLALVDPLLAVEGDDAVELRWSPVAAGPHEVRFEQDHPVPVFSTLVTGSETAVDPRVLEDTSGRIVLTGTTSDAVEGSDVTLTWRSPGIGYASRVGPPPSRGRPCAVVVADEAAVSPPTGAACGLTDGDLVSPAVLASACDDDGTCAAPRAVQIDLGTTVPIELIVVRGCVGGCAVDVRSADGTWRPVGAAAADHGVVTAGGAAADSVRVGLGDGATTLREVSVWGPMPDDVDLSLDPTSDEASLRDRFALGGSGNGRPWWPIALAATAAAGLLVGCGVLLGRRRPSVLP